MPEISIESGYSLVLKGAAEDEPVAAPVPAGQARRNRSYSGNLAPSPTVSEHSERGQEGDALVTMSKVDELSFKFNKVAYEYSLILKEKDSLKRENELLKKQLEVQRNCLCVWIMCC